MIVGLLLKLYHSVTDRPTDGRMDRIIAVLLRSAELTCGKNASLQQTQSLILQCINRSLPHCIVGYKLVRVSDSSHLQQ